MDTERQDLDIRAGALELRGRFDTIQCRHRDIHDHHIRLTLPRLLPGGLTIAVSVYLIFDFAVITTLFAMIFKILPDVKTQWRDMWIGAAMTAIFFLIGKWALGLYLGSGTAASAYGAASSLITLLLWIYYSSQILLFGAEFTQVYASEFGARLEPSAYAVRIERKEIEKPSR